MLTNKVCKKLLKVILPTTAILCLSISATAATLYSTPSNSNFKAYMDYNTITCKTSKQYALQRMATTTPNGFRIYNGRYCIAIGTGYDASVGTYVDVELSNGTVLQCVVGDIKRNVDTYADNKQCRHNNSVVEFIVDDDKLNSAIKNAGSAHALKELSGDVVSLTRYTDEDASELGWEEVIVDPENTNSYLVTNKYTVEVGDQTIYMVEYAIATDYSTMAVDKETYDSLTVNYSVITR